MKGTKKQINYANDLIRNFLVITENTKTGWEKSKSRMEKRGKNTDKLVKNIALMNQLLSLNFENAEAGIVIERLRDLIPTMTPVEEHAFNPVMHGPRLKLVIDTITQ